MIAASRSRPECKASDNTPKLPVRRTRNDFSDSNTTADATLSNAARFFSRTSKFCRISIASVKTILNFAPNAERLVSTVQPWKVPR